MKFFKYLGIIILGLVFLSATIIYFLKIQRDSKTWVENIEVAKNTSIPIELTYSQRKVYGGHGLGWGGGAYKNSIKFNYNGVNYFHETPYIPVVLKMYQKQFYVVYYDRETYTPLTTYRFYKSIDKRHFKEVEPINFPKHVAIQNRWFKGGNTREGLVGLIPENLQGTTTARIWLVLDGKQKMFDGPNPPNVVNPLKFIKQYKEKYITNREE